MQQVKLVIWDLDETFWVGTLSEGGAVVSERNAAVVRELTDRGIVNSICSKNSFDEARIRLVEAGVWDLFVFPKIQWSPKGQLISEIIAEMQLRAPNVLFIDDNPLNLREAVFYNPGLQTAGPAIIERLLKLPACQGKADATHARLRQYRILERKQSDRRRSTSDNDDFLRQSGIRVALQRTCGEEQARILELINRTNQLNYTRKRLSAAQLEALLQDPALETACLRVRDNYGDYGVCGFYALRENVLEHFLFSCRILNMGVEQWLYHRLGNPRIDIAGECATPLRSGVVPDWICEVEPADFQERADAATGGGPRVLLKGGCDLEQIRIYLNRAITLDTELTCVSAAGLSVHGEHTEILRRCRAETLERYGEIIDALPFVERHTYQSSFFQDRHDSYIYSVLQDYTQGLYRYGDTDFVVPYGDFTVDLTDPRNWPVLEHAHRRKKRLSRNFLAWFRTRFVFLGPLPPEAFAENIDWLCRRIKAGRQLILLNGSEIPYQKCPEQERWNHHRTMNRVLETVAAGHDHVVICDVRRFLRDPRDHSNNLRHYNRRTYFLIARHLEELLGRRFDVAQPVLQKVARAAAFYIGFFIRILRRNVFRWLLPLKS